MYTCTLPKPCVCLFFKWFTHTISRVLISVLEDVAWGWLWSTVPLRLAVCYFLVVQWLVIRTVHFIMKIPPPSKAVDDLPKAGPALIQLSSSAGVYVWTLKAWTRRVKIIYPSICCWWAVQKAKFEQSSNSPSWMLKEKKQKQWVCKKTLSAGVGWFVFCCLIKQVVELLFEALCLSFREPASVSICARQGLGIQKIY